ncbi:zf-B_box domain-containing protein [Cephalotus follicularis]|uniref:Zf-B_box domain-containing protein n=1 Tax=Cephalotus follicularis TaxID=3775 RepID=A0A1Q3C2K7_CEPFO|nr:zf-B_box domain-containing protein [Cephalotus follicularis]
MKGCELCGHVARMYCESDEASLCWACDEKVHGANFLVAKHTRTLLCHACQAPTPWKSSGPKLTSTVSVCQSCVNRHNEKCEAEDDESIDDVGSYVDDDDDDSDSDTGINIDEEGENQVVPSSCCDSSASRVQSPRVESSYLSGDEGETSFVGGGNGVTLKRMPETSHLDSEEEIGCSSTQLASNEEATSMRPLKQPRTIEDKLWLIIKQSQDQLSSLTHSKDSKKR